MFVFCGLVTIKFQSQRQIYKNKQNKVKQAVTVMSSIIVGVLVALLVDGCSHLSESNHR